jgi:hypothetical protein
MCHYRSKEAKSEASGDLHQRSAKIKAKICEINRSVKCNQN